MQLVPVSRDKISRPAICMEIEGLLSVGPQRLVYLRQIMLGLETLQDSDCLSGPMCTAIAVFITLSLPDKLKTYLSGKEVEERDTLNQVSLEHLVLLPDLNLHMLRGEHEALSFV